MTSMNLGGIASLFNDLQDYTFSLYVETLY